MSIQPQLSVEMVTCKGSCLAFFVVTMKADVYCIARIALDNEIKMNKKTAFSGCECPVTRVNGK